MRINKIILNNFGSYESCNIFNTKISSQKNIILIGGKNGAGKTTLFSAMKICLYGYKSMGYKSYNSYYVKTITKMINNNAKLLKPSYSYISMEIELNNKQGIDTYILKREWTLSDSLIENFIITKNGCVLSEEDSVNFEKYLLSLIPPDLFNLFFFDGEKVSDYFIGSGSNLTMKNAFLTLCGYDIFEIMRKNFKRISENTSCSNKYLNDYIVAKDELENVRNDILKIEQEREECIDQIKNCEADIIQIENVYRNNGGITEHEWHNKINLLKNEEKKREKYNILLKKLTNEIVPFIILKKELEKIKEQINIENESMKYSIFCNVLDNKKISSMVSNIDKIKDEAYRIFGNNDPLILNLSFEQKSLILSQINKILTFEKDKIEKIKNRIRDSIKLSSKIRENLDRSNISTAQDYMKNRAKLFESKSYFLQKQVELDNKLNIYSDKLRKCEISFEKNKKNLEKEIKQDSINDISSRAIIMIDKLQNILYRKEIEKVEDNFRKNINILMRKIKFIDDIYIDENFIVHIYRNEKIRTKKLLEIILSNSESQLRSILGIKSINKLYDISDVKDRSSLINYIKHYPNTFIDLPIEIDKSTLSNGEKQIFVMTLYYSLICLCKHEIPFIIDTPFARIDTEHRNNISKYFFKQLNGQIFILSTNEEINNKHFNILKNKIASTFLLENIDNKKTIVHEDKYFKE